MVIGGPAICKRGRKAFQTQQHWQVSQTGLTLNQFYGEGRMDEARNDNARQAALDYHEFPKPGKLEIRATKPLANGRDLARAYSPGVAEACL